MLLPLALVQMRCSEDPRENLDKALVRIEEAAAQGARVVCLQELFRSTYPCQTEDPARFELAEPIPGPSTEALTKLAEARGVAVVASLFERRAEGLYHNTAVVIDAEGRLLGSYRKMHIPDDPLYYEKFYFTPGDLGFQSFECRAGRVGMLVCWDQWFPEAARLTALTGAEILFYPTAIGWQFDEGDEVDTAQKDAWQTVQRAHAIANGVFVVAVNRVGAERLPAAGAGEGIRFTNCVTNSPVCIPTRLSLATGWYPHNTGVWNNMGHQMSADTSTWMGAVRDAGYRTSLFGKTHLHPHGGDLRDREGLMHAYGLDDVNEIGGPRASANVLSHMTAEWEEKGVWEAYREDYRERFSNKPHVVRPSVVGLENYADVYVGQKAKTYLERYDRSQPWFCWVSFGGPHEPWDTPEPYASMYDPNEMPPAVSRPPGDLWRTWGERRRRR